MGVRHGVHTNLDVAGRSRFGRVVAPLAMLDVWTNPGLAYQRDSDPRGAAFERLDVAGYTSAVAVSSELVQVRPLVEGDALRSTLLLEAVSPEKATALGPAHFVTTRQEFFVAEEPVGHSRFTVMKFRPTGETRQSAAAAPSNAHAAEGATLERDELGTVVASSVQPGQPIASTRVPITATLIVAGALATSDFFEGHHDHDAARQQGSRDIFMNIHTTLGLVERCIGGWLGPNVLWRSMSVRLGVPNYPGDVMVVSGEVATVDAQSGATQIDFRAANGLGVHAHGSVMVELPILS